MWFLRRASLLTTLCVLGCSTTFRPATNPGFVADDEPALAEGDNDPRTSESLPSPLRLQDVVQLASSQRSEIVAARSLAEAAAQRPAIESALDDPMLMVQALHVPFRTLGFSGGIMIQQSFPLSRVLARRRVAAQHEARAFEAGIATVELDVEFDAARAFFMVHEARRVLEILTTQLELAEQIVAATTARYAAALGSEAEVLRAEAEQARIEGELAAMSEEARATEAMLNASIGRAPDGSVPPLAVELGDPTGPTDPVDVALTNRPELDQARTRVEAADARVQITRAQFAPMGLVQLGPAFSMTDGPGLMGTIGISLPIYLGWRRAGVREAHAMARMARSDVAAMENMIRGETAVNQAQAGAARIRHEALEQEGVPRARQAIDATLASYAAGQLPLVNVLEAMDAYWMSQADEVMAEVELGLAQARLDRSIGSSP